MPYIILNSAKVFPDFGSTSNWCAIGGVDERSHIQLKLMRVDSSSTSVSDSSGNTKLASITNAPSSLTVGGKVHATIYDVGSVVLASGLFNIISYSGSTLVIDCPFPTGASFARLSFITDYENFRFRFEFENDSEVIATSVGQVGPDMTTFLNVTPFTRHLLQAKMKKQPTSGNNDVSDFMDNLVTVNIYEVYNGPDGPFDDESTGDAININIVNAANQTGNTYGISLVDKITNTTPSQLLKFLRGGVEPTYFIGFPFHMTFIYSSLMTGLAFDMERLECDTNGTTLASTDQAITTTHIGHVNRLFVRGSVIAGTDHFLITLRKNSGNAALSETMKVRYRCAPIRPVQLWWLNTDGSWDQHVFGIKQTKNITVASGGEFSQFEEDLALMDSDSDYLSVDGFQTMTLGDDGLDENDCLKMQNLRTSVKTYVLLNPDTWSSAGEKFFSVKKNMGTFELSKTNNALGSVSITIQYPKLNIQTL